MFDPKLAVFNSKKRFIDYPESLVDIHDVKEVKYFNNESDLVLYDVPPIDTIKKLIFDIETTGLDPHADDARVYMIGVKCDFGAERHREIILTNKNEKQLLVSFITLLTELKPDVIANHNIFNFDLPYLEARYFYNNIKPPFRRGSRKKILETARVFGKAIEFTPYYCDRAWFKKEISIIDTYHQLLIWDDQKKLLADNEYNLKDAPRILGLREGRDRVLMPYKEMMRRYQAWMTGLGDLEEMKAYVLDDIRDAMLLLELILPPIHYQKRFLNWTLQSLSTAGNASKWSSILENHYKHFNIYYNQQPDPKLNYQGAYTKAIPGLYGGGDCEVIQIDFSSLYPMTILRNGVYPTKKDKLAVFLMYMDYMTSYRLSIKHSTDQTLQYLQAALKILINSGYGAMGSSAPCNDMAAAAFITSYSRKITKFVEQLVYDNGDIVVQIDTDGLVCITRDSKKLMKVVNDNLPNGFKMDCDYYDYIFIPSFPDGKGKKKNYFLFKDGKIKKQRGITRSRATLPLKKEFYNRYLTRYAYKGAVNAMGFYSQLKELINSGKLPYDLITIRKTASIAEKKVYDLGLVNEDGQAVFYYGDVTQVKTYKNGKMKVQVTQDKVNKGEYSRSYYNELLAEIVEEIDLAILHSENLPPTE